MTCLRIGAWAQGSSVAFPAQPEVPLEMRSAEASGLAKYDEWLRSFNFHEDNAQIAHLLIKRQAAAIGIKKPDGTGRLL